MRFIQRDSLLDGRCSLGSLGSLSSPSSLCSPGSPSSLTFELLERTKAVLAELFVTLYSASRSPKEITENKIEYSDAFSLSLILLKRPNEIHVQWIGPLCAGQ